MASCGLDERRRDVDLVENRRCALHNDSRDGLVGQRGKSERARTSVIVRREGCDSLSNKLGLGIGGFFVAFIFLNKQEDIFVGDDAHVSPGVPRFTTDKKWDVHARSGHPASPNITQLAE